MEKMKKTTIAIINWNGIRWLKTLPKIIEYSKEANIVLIDNNSTDKSIFYTKKILKLKSLSIKIIMDLQKVTTKQLKKLNQSIFYY